MPNDISQHREGENRRSDQVRRDASSSNGGRVRDFATWQFQLHEKQQRATEQQTNGKGLAPAERKNRRAIDENGQLVERTVNLRNRYDRDHPGLPGGMNYWNLPERSPGQPELTEEEKRLHDTWRPSNESSSGRDLNQGLAINMEQQRAAQVERTGNIESLIDHLIRYPGRNHQTEKIRVDMRADKMNATEFEYARGYIERRADIDRQRKKELRQTILACYCK
jgi:hypothetical protein